MLLKALNVLERLQLSVGMCINDKNSRRQGLSTVPHAPALLPKYSANSDFDNIGNSSPIGILILQMQEWGDQSNLLTMRANTSARTTAIESNCYVTEQGCAFLLACALLLCMLKAASRRLWSSFGRVACQRYYIPFEMYISAFCGQRSPTILVRIL